VTLGGTARRFGVPALLVNCAGTCEGQPAGGGSFALDRAGRVTGRLGASQEGVLLVDAVTTAATALPVAL
jgi:predicted amidohydrolase